MTAGPMLRASNGFSMAADGAGVAARRASGLTACGGLGGGFLPCATSETTQHDRSRTSAATRRMDGASRSETGWSYRRGIWFGSGLESGGRSRPTPQRPCAPCPPGRRRPHFAGALRSPPAVGAQHDPEQIGVRQVSAHAERAGALRGGHDRFAGVRAVHRQVRESQRVHRLAAGSVRHRRRAPRAGWRRWRRHARAGRTSDPP